MEENIKTFSQIMKYVKFSQEILKITILYYFQVMGTVKINNAKYQLI